MSDKVAVGSEGAKPRIAVIYYSMYGHVKVIISQFVTHFIHIIHSFVVIIIIVIVISY